MCQSVQNFSPNEKQNNFIFVKIENILKGDLLKLAAAPQSIGTYRTRAAVIEGDHLLSGQA